MNLKEVNHLNGVKTDNMVSNLEFCTRSENVKHAYSIGLYKPTRARKKVVDACTNQVYKSISEAARANNIPYNTCKNILNGASRNTTCLKFAA